MKRHIFIFLCCMVSLIAATAVSAQGFTGPGAYPPSPPPPGPGRNPPPPPPLPLEYQKATDKFGFTDPAQTVTVEQAKTFAHITPVIVTGTIVQAIGGDLYTFRDSSGEIVLRIGPREWYTVGSTISPSESIEISGELHRDWQGAPEIHARYIRRK